MERYVYLIIMGIHLAVWSSNCSWSVQCCALSKSSWNSSQSAMLWIALNSLVSSAHRYRYVWIISEGMLLIKITTRSVPRTVAWGFHL